MEFKFRAGEDRPSPYLNPSTTDGYFTAQAMRAGYIGSDHRRADPLQMHPLQNPIIPAREALRRELEKERIREEIIAREILRKRELEEEVRRELAYEREIALRRQADRFSLAGSAPLSAAALHSEQRLLLPPPGHGVRVVERFPISGHHHDVGIVERFPISGRHDVGIVERLPISGRHDVGFVERLPAQRLIEARESDIRQIPEVGKGKIVYLGNSTSSPNIAGIKRKAAVEITEFISPKKVQKERFCAVCQVSTTSEQALNEHLQGKKHKAKEVELRVSKPGGKNIGDSSPISETADKSKLVKKDTDNSGQQKTQVGQSEQQQVPKKQNGIVKKQLLRCEHCKVKCNSELMLSSHLKGKKHLARMQELASSKAVLKERGKVVAALTEGNGKVVRVVKVKRGKAKKGKEEAVASETTKAPSDKTLTTDTTKEKSCNMDIKEEQG